MKSILKRSQPQDPTSTTVNYPRHKIFIFKDEKSSSYGPPMTMENRGTFLRMVQEELQKGQAIWVRHPHDFSMFEIGEYDAHMGDVYMYETKNCLGLVLDHKVNN